MWWPWLASKGAAGGQRSRAFWSTRSRKSRPGARISGSAGSGKGPAGDSRGPSTTPSGLGTREHALAGVANESCPPGGRRLDAITRQAGRRSLGGPRGRRPAARRHHCRTGTDDFASAVRDEFEHLQEQTWGQTPARLGPRFMFFGFCSGRPGSGPSFRRTRPRGPRRRGQRVRASASTDGARRKRTDGPAKPLALLAAQAHHDDHLAGPPRTPCRKRAYATDCAVVAGRVRPRLPCGPLGQGPGPDPARGEGPPR